MLGLLALVHHRRWACEGRGVHCSGWGCLGLSVAKNVTAFKVRGGVEYDLHHSTSLGYFRTVAYSLQEGDGEEDDSTS